MSAHTACAEVLQGDLKASILDAIILKASFEASQLLAYRLVCKAWSEYVSKSEPWQMLVVDHTERLMYRIYQIDHGQTRRQRSIHRNVWCSVLGGSSLALAYEH